MQIKSMNKSHTIVSSSEPLTDRGLKHRFVQNSVTPIPRAPMSNEIIHTQEHNHHHAIFLRNL